MSTPFVFNTAAYASGQFATGSFNSSTKTFTTDQISTQTYYLNGTINQAGDSVFVSQNSNGTGGTFSLYATNFDNSGDLVFNLAQDNSSIYYIISNSFLTINQNITFTESQLGDYQVCFASGTLIRTTRGDVAVETLTMDDVAITRDGRRKPIRWIGHRHVRCDDHPEPRKVWPVRVAAGTFGNGLPYADLWLSRNHALCLENCLIPVRGLLDENRVAQIRQAEVTYWHVEVDGHDVLLANGLPAESYLDTGNRRGFEKAGVALLHFDEEPAAAYDGAGYCLPLIESGPRLSEIRAHYGLGRAPATEQTAFAVHLVADGAVLSPVLADENELRFVVPAGTTELRLSSPSFAADGEDVRQLGVLVNALAVSDGSGWRAVNLDDPGLFAGFHEIEHDQAGTWRWTDGEAHLSPTLWSGLAGAVLLRLQGMFGRPTKAEAADADRLAA